MTGAWGRVRPRACENVVSNEVATKLAYCRHGEMHEAIYRRRVRRTEHFIARVLDDYKGEDNPVRVVDAFVERLDLQ